MRAVGEGGGDAGFVLAEALEFRAAADRRSGLGRPFGEQPFDLGLHDEEQVRVPCRRVGEVERKPGVVHAGPRAPVREEAVEQSPLVEDFKGADVQAPGARFGGAWFGLAFEDLHVDSGEAQLAREHESGGPGTGDHHLGLGRLLGHHRSVLWLWRRGSAAADAVGVGHGEQFE